MLKRGYSRQTMAVALVASVMLVAAGTAIASNMGFKLNKPIFQIPAGPVSAKGNNWTSIPYFNPYGTVSGFCTQTGLSSTGGPLVPKATLTSIKPQTGVATSVQCGSSAALTAPFPGFCLPAPCPAGLGVLIRQPTVAGFPAGIIIVGSHDPSLTVTVFGGAPSPTGDNWVTVPYHTTAVFMNDFCLSAGLSSTGGPLVPKAQITRVDATTGAPTSANCGSSQAASIPLVLGEAIRVREPNGPKSFIPAHF